MSIIFYCITSVSEQVTKIRIGIGFRFSLFCRGEAVFYAQEDIILTFKWSKLPTIDKHLISLYSQTSESNNRVMRIRKMILN